MPGASPPSRSGPPPRPPSFHMYITNGRSKRPSRPPSVTLIRLKVEPTCRSGASSPQAAEHAGDHLLEGARGAAGDRIREGDVDRAAGRRHDLEISHEAVIEREAREEVHRGDVDAGLRDRPRRAVAPAWLRIRPAEVEDESPPFLRQAQVNPHRPLLGGVLPFLTGREAALTEVERLDRAQRRRSLRTADGRSRGSSRRRRADTRRGRRSSPA